MLTHTGLLIVSHKPLEPCANRSVCLSVGGGVRTETAMELERDKSMRSQSMTNPKQHQNPGLKQRFVLFFENWEDKGSWERPFPPTCHCGTALFWLVSMVPTKTVNMSNKSNFPNSSFHPLQYRIWTTRFPRGGRRFSDWTGTTLAPKQEADNRSDPPYTEQQTEAVKCIYTPITFTSQRAHGARAREEERRQTTSPSRSTRNYW